MDKTSMEIKYPWPIPAGMVGVCLLLLAAMFRGPVHPGTIVATIGAIALTIHLLAYRIVINSREVRVRRAPFLTSSTQLHDVTRLVEDTTLILVTPKSKIPLWGLSIAGRETLFGLLPRHLDVMPPPRTAKRGGDAAAAVRRHKRWTLFAGIGFLATAGLVVLFFKGFPLHAYWDAAGQYLLLLCLCFFIAMVFEAAFTWVLWSSRRDLNRSEEGNMHRQR
jgi:hypothetical protein